VAELVWKARRTRSARALDPAEPPLLRVHEAYGTGAGPNRLVEGDRLDVLKSLREDLAGRVSLVYVDPPFATGKSFALRVPIPGAPEGAGVVVPAYEDYGDLDRWLQWFYETAVLIRELLAPGASLYAHLDSHVVHYAKVLLDEVFGHEAFQREVIWRIGWISGFKSRARSWIRNHDSLLFYTKGSKPKTFHKEYAPYPSGYRRRDGSMPTAAGYPIDDVWNGSEVDRLDSIQIKSFSTEKVGYPTQKNEALLARIVRASSNPGDLVLDCFAGSGTTAVVAETLGRRWIVSDVSPLSIHTTRKRLLRMSGVGPFVVQSLKPSAGVGINAGRVRIRCKTNGLAATVEIVGFGIKRTQLSASARSAVEHWSQWIDCWCADWDHRGGELKAGSTVTRVGADQSLQILATHEYSSPGPHMVMVRVFDIFGGSTTAKAEIVISQR